MSYILYSYLTFACWQVDCVQWGRPNSVGCSVWYDRLQRSGVGIGCSSTQQFVPFNIHCASAAVDSGCTLPLWHRPSKCHCQLLVSDTVPNAGTEAAVKFLPAEGYQGHCGEPACHLQMLGRGPYKSLISPLISPYFPLFPPISPYLPILIRLLYVF